MELFSWLFFYKLQVVMNIEIGTVKLDRSNLTPQVPRGAIVVGCSKIMGILTTPPSKLLPSIRALIFWPLFRDNDRLTRPLNRAFCLGIDRGSWEGHDNRDPYFMAENCLRCFPKTISLKCFPASSVRFRAKFPILSPELRAFWRGFPYP